MLTVPSEIEGLTVLNEVEGEARAVSRRCWMPPQRGGGQAAQARHDKQGAPPRPQMLKSRRIQVGTEADPSGVSRLEAIKLTPIRLRRGDNDVITYL
jgi:hypothetical protein